MARGPGRCWSSSGPRAPRRSFRRASIRAASRSRGRRTANPAASRGRSSGPTSLGSQWRSSWRDTGPVPARATTPPSRPEGSSSGAGSRRRWQPRWWGKRPGSLATRSGPIAATRSRARRRSLARGDAVTGGPRLGACLRGDGARVVARIRQWLGATEPDEAPTSTDAGNAIRFARRHGAVARYCYEWQRWLLWTGTHWQRDAGAGIMRLAKETARAIYREASAAPGEDARRRLLAWAARSESEPGLRRMLVLAQSELPVKPSELDADPFALNCPNGTLDLRTLHLRPHRREDFLTKVTAAPYDPDARNPIWDAFLVRSLPAEALRTYVQRVAGYALTGNTAEEKLFLVHGPTAGGKSTFLGALRRAWGDYATTADFSTFTTRKGDGGPRDDLARLHGARLVISVEITDGARLNEHAVKTWTGGDLVVARRLYQETFEFAPQCKLVVAANQRPHARDDDDALWRRIVEIPFAESLPAAERDPDVKAFLTDPAQAGTAILAWAAQGAADWFANGLGSAPEIDAATAALPGGDGSAGRLLQGGVRAGPGRRAAGEHAPAGVRDLVPGLRRPVPAEPREARGAARGAGVPAAPGECGDSILGGRSTSHAQ